jgi:arsenate reductase
MSKKRRKVLFLCTGNSCRSQMAEGLLRHFAGDRFEARSAGLSPREHVHPLAIRVMAEIGIDIGRQRPKSVKVYLGRETISFVITVCTRAEDSCPHIWPGLAEKNRLYWPLDDPVEVNGPKTEQLAAFRQVRELLQKKIDAWLATMNI